MAKRRGCVCICARKFPQSTGISVGMFNWVLQRYLSWPHGLDNRSYVYFRLFHPWSTIVVGRYRFPLCWLLSSSKLRLHILRLAKSPNKDTERLETKTWVFLEVESAGVRKRKWYGSLITNFQSFVLLELWKVTLQTIFWLNFKVRFNGDQKFDPELPTQSAWVWIFFSCLINHKKKTFLWFLLHRCSIESAKYKSVGNGIDFCFAKKCCAKSAMDFCLISSFHPPPLLCWQKKEAKNWGKIWLEKENWRIRSPLPCQLKSVGGGAFEPCCIMRCSTAPQFKKRKCYINSWLLKCVVNFPNGHLPFRQGRL